MNISAQETHWTLFPDAAAVARHAADRVLAAAGRAIAERGVFRLVLAGGGTPLLAYRQLARSNADWGCWRLYHGDERCLPADHPQRNSRLCADAWLDPAAFPAEGHFPIPAELGAEAAAAEYARVLETARPFDLVLLGMGEDGHTASLFPGRDEPPGVAVAAVHQAPKPPPDRVSLSSALLSDAREVLFLVTGEAKRDALSRWRAGEALPAARIRARDRLEVLMDRQALLPQDLDPGQGKSGTDL
jgi:6-phosphogluconolactonase